jgi:hypothetical protein
MAYQFIFNSITLKCDTYHTDREDSRIPSVRGASRLRIYAQTPWYNVKIAKYTGLLSYIPFEYIRPGDRGRGCHWVDGRSINRRADFRRSDSSIHSAVALFLFALKAMAKMQEPSTLQRSRIHANEPYPLPCKCDADGYFAASGTL